MKTTSPVSSDWQISSHFWASVGKGTTLSQLGSEKVGWPRPTLTRGLNRKLQGPALGNGVGGGELGVELGLKSLLCHL